METTQTLTELERFTKAAGEIISPAFISTDPYEIEATSADLSLLPKYHYKFKEEYRATHVVRPKNLDELSGIMTLCRKSALPVTIRAAGTSCYSASSPTKGGVVVDMRRMNTVHEVNVDTRTVRCDAGTSWLKLNSALLDYGLAPMVYPTSFKSGCVGGYVATAGKAGIGSAKHGGIADTLVSVTMVKPDGTVEKISKASSGDLKLDDIVESLGIYGAIAEIEMKVTTMKTSMEMSGYGFTTIDKAMDFFFALKDNIVNKPFFLSLSDKKFEKLAHKTLPTREFFVYSVYFDDPDVTANAVAFTKDTAAKFDGLSAEDWYLKEKWMDIADTELNLGRICRNPVFQEYWIADARSKEFYQTYRAMTKNLLYKDAFYMMAGSHGGNRMKIFGLSDIADSREFFGIKSYFHELTKLVYGQEDRLYTVGVVNTFYYLKFDPSGADHKKALKNKLDPDSLVNSHRFVLAKMKYWRVQLLFWVAKALYKMV